ncbi:prolyl oligopeptidase family serine peptidase [Edaphobacter aggregans]|uniref:prolyl oligopeptidase family serine peptidase n=1 Tax=Edaphobacter aggregans TaxID=570835 RepID=UPI00146FEC8E|nr:prolyl oligopeptidase family serine peptidase [Edaphobacter aggregans]
MSTLPFAPVEEIIHGVVVFDPYRWLEDRSLPETEEWIVDQQQRCEQYFSECGTLDALRSRVRDYLDVEVVDQPTKVAGRYFCRRRDPGQEQASIYVRGTATRPERLLVDPSDQGAFASVSIHRISEDGSLMAYEVKHGGGDGKAIHVVDVETGSILPDRLDTGYARGFAFASDKGGFYYCHESSTASKDHTIRQHRFHEPSVDQVVFRLSCSRGSRLVLIADSVNLGAIRIRQEGSELVSDFFIAQQAKPLVWKQVFVNKVLPYSPFLKHGHIFALSFDGAPNGKLVELNDNGCEIRTIIPEQEAAIRQLVFAGNRIFTSHLRYLISSIRRWTLLGENQGSIDIPLDGTIQLFPNQSETETGLFYSYESFTQPPAVFEYLPEVGKSRLYHQRHSAVMHSPCSVERVSFSSKDGTRIPMTLVALEKCNRSVDTPVILTSYGGFGVSMTPQFSVFVSIMMELGAVIALPHIRGGGEFGKEWHDAARGRNRQAAFDDFVGAADWLCASGETNPQRLAIFGGSNSGLLVGAVVTQRPELFRAALCIAPLLDMVRYEHFDQASKWRQEYGTTAKAEDFHAIYAYSPYHHIANNVDYPAVLFVTGDKDDRCNPAHVRKMAARLQERDQQPSPVVVDYRAERGHSPVMPLTIRVDALARRIAFLCRELNLPVVFGGCHETVCS